MFYELKYYDIKMIKDLLTLMTKAEEREFIRFLEKRNKRTDVRNVQLFKQYLNGNEKVQQNEIGANAFNVLKKRLTDNLLDFLSIQILDKESTTEISIIKQLLICRKLFLHGIQKKAFKLLRELEKRAIAIHHYSLLNEVYQTFIQYSYHLSQIEHEEIFQKFGSNTTELLEEGKLNMAYAIIKKAYHRVEFGSEQLNFKKLLKETYDTLMISPERGYSFVALYQLAEIADVSGAYAKDYHAVDLFFVDHLDKLADGPSDTVKFNHHHIEILYLISNIYFRQKRFEESLQFLGKMFIQMQRFGGIYFQAKFIKYSTLLALNYNFTRSPKKAIQAIDLMINTRKFTFEELLNPALTKLMIYFQQGELLEAKKIAASFTKTDLYYERKMGLDWILNKNFAELLLHIELGNVDYVDSRLKSLKRKLEQHLKKKGKSRILDFLKRVSEYYTNHSIINEQNYRKKVTDMLMHKPAEKEDVLLISFYAWLKAKIDCKPVYDVTLELVELK